MRDFVLSVLAGLAGLLIICGLMLVIGIGTFAAYHYDGASAACAAAPARFDQCPPDCRCPAQPWSPRSIEIGEPASVNQRTLHEPKGGPGCVTCPKQPPIVHPFVQPATSLPTASRISATEETKFGAFACERCKQATVGEDWQEMWADDDTPLTCVCRKCWNVMPPTERKSTLTNFATRAALKSKQMFFVKEAIETLTQN